MLITQTWQRSAHGTPSWWGCVQFRHNSQMIGSYLLFWHVYTVLELLYLVWNVISSLGEFWRSWTSAGVVLSTGMSLLRLLSSRRCNLCNLCTICAICAIWWSWNNDTALWEYADNSYLQVLLNVLSSVIWIFENRFLVMLY